MVAAAAAAAAVPSPLVSWEGSVVELPNRTEEAPPQVYNDTIGPTREGLPMDTGVLARN